VPCTTLPALTTTHGLQIVRDFLPGFNPAAAPPAPSVTPHPPPASTSGESAETVAVRGGGGGARAALPDGSAVMDFSTIEDLYALGTAALLLAAPACGIPRTHARAHTVGSPIPPLRRSASPLVRHYYKRRCSLEKGACAYWRAGGVRMNGLRG
jgi:hypothetical protein